MTNLHPDLTESDLKQLFSGIGPIKFVKLQLNTSGQSTGIAFVGYERAPDCSYAIEEFDGRRAAGQVISVENAVPLADRIFSARPAKSGRKQKKKKAPKTERRQKKSVEELDAELTAYMQGPPEESAEPATEPTAVAEPAPVAAEPAATEPVAEAPAEPAPAFAPQDNGEMES